MISVYDKTGIVDFARELNRLDIEIVATSGTCRTLREGTIDSVRSVTSIDRSQLEGQVSTLQSQIEDKNGQIADLQSQIANLR